MSTSEQEKVDLAAMLAEFIERKLSAFDYMTALSKMTPEQLTHTGNRAGLGPALIRALQNANDEIIKMGKAHVRKYPD